MRASGCGRIKRPLVGAMLCLCAAAHAAFAWQHRERRPDLEILESPPSAAARTFLSFGDEQFLYRRWALNMQNAGDTGGRATPMSAYNYDHVLGWLESLAALDPRAQHHTFLAVRYFSQTPDVSNVRKLVDFIVADGMKAPQEKWYWITQAVAMADVRLKDLPYALRIAKGLAVMDLPDAPNWVFMFPAVLLEKMGRFSEALSWITAVKVKKWDVLREDERLWLEDFILRLPKV